MDDNDYEDDNFEQIDYYTSEFKGETVNKNVTQAKAGQNKAGHGLSMDSNNNQKAKKEEIKVGAKMSYQPQDNKSKIPSVDASVASSAQKINKQASAARVPQQFAPSGDENIDKLRNQNEKLKVELKDLTDKLEIFLERSKQKRVEKRNAAMSHGEEDGLVREKEQELLTAQQRLVMYKKEITAMRKQLEGTYNIDKIVKLEDELKDRQRVLSELEKDKDALIKVQKEQDKALNVLTKEGDYDKKISQLNGELSSTKENVRTLKNKLRDEEKVLKNQLQQLMAMEEKCRKLVTLVNEKKSKKADDIGRPYVSVTEEAIERLKNEVKQAEYEKNLEEKRLRQEVASNEQKMKSMEHEINILSIQLKEKEQECRLNDLKIRELKRHIPHKALKPIDSSSSQTRKDRPVSIDGIRRSDLEDKKREDKAIAKNELNSMKEEKKNADISNQKHAPLQKHAEKPAEVFKSPPLNQIKKEDVKVEESSPVQQEAPQEEAKGVFSKPMMMKKKKF